MKVKIFVTLLMLMALMPVAFIAAESGDSAGGETYKKEYYRHKDYYKTWTVVEVSDTEIFLQRTKRNGEIDTATIELSRRPNLEVGDKVRYDKIRDRLRKTLK